MKFEQTNQPDSEYTPEMSEIPEEYIELWDCLNVTDDIWNRTIELAREEEGSGKEKRGLYHDIPLEDLVELGEKVRAEPDPREKYRLLTEVAPNGKIWFDVLAGLTTEEIVQSLDQVIGQEKWGRGLDIGAGTGKLTEPIEKHCDQFVALDQADFLLSYAKAKTQNTNLIAATALRLPFKRETFDLVTSTGLTSAFTVSDATIFADQLMRILSTGGSYFEGFLQRPGAGKEYHPSERRNMANAKGVLADLIVGQSSGKAAVPEKQRLTGNKLVDIFKRAGFTPRLHEDEERGVIMVEFAKPSGF